MILKDAEATGSNDDIESRLSEAIVNVNEAASDINKNILENVKGS